ncbi:MAG: hypothetical protein BMS9Abin29_2576 [Gemmatimonadota bacterium]|nr:MAG: hypothetical protein BMS9Abin29_2576 [Gemmatimonadota bacterium]
MTPRDRGVAREGFTLVELVITLGVFGIILAAGLAFMVIQNRAFTRGSERLLVVQSLRYVVQQLEIDLQAAGSNVPRGQPRMVYAGSDVIAFTGDHTSNLRNDISAVYVDIDAPNGWVQAPLGPTTLPLVGVNWPDTAYLTAGGTNSPAELIILYFEPDTSTVRADDFVLKRRVNNREPEVVARQLLRQGSTPFFRYYQRRDFASQTSVLDSLPDTALPLFHAVKIHGSAGDTGMSARGDSIRAVRVSYRVTNGLTGASEQFAEVSRVINLPNMGARALRTCGAQPILGVPLLLSQVVNSAGDPAVRLDWDPAVDELAGERDVVRYVIYRRLTTDPEWGDPYLSIPAGAPLYVYDDTSIEIGSSYEYAISAQDCTPTLSGLSSPVQILVM